MDADHLYSEDLNCAVLWDERNNNHFFHPSNLPPCCQSLDGQIHRPVNLFKSRKFVVPEIARRQSMRIQDDKENDHNGNSSEQGHRLISNLGFHLSSDKVNLSSWYKQQVQLANFACPNCIISGEDPSGLNRPRVEHKKDGYLFPKDETMNSNGNPFLPTFHDLPFFFRTLQSFKYLRPVQQLLDEVVCVSNAVQFGPDKMLKKNMSGGVFTNNGGRSLQLEQSTDFEKRELIFSSQNSSEDQYTIQIRITKLAALLDELENQYEQYCHQIEGVVASFEVIAGTGAAKSYIALTIQAMSRHFLNFRGAIVAQIHTSRESFSKEINRKHDSQISLFNQNSRRDRETLQNLSMIQVRQVWRSLRGLPTNSVAILRSWLLEHFLHPYPNDDEKLFLASLTGLTKTQISNWFINARVRLWKPMIEEIYREELSDASGDSNASSL